MGWDDPIGLLEQALCRSGSNSELNEISSFEGKSHHEEFRIVNSQMLADIEFWIG